MWNATDEDPSIRQLKRIIFKLRFSRSDPSIIRLFIKISKPGVTLPGALKEKLATIEPIIADLDVDLQEETAEKWRLQVMAAVNRHISLDESFTTTDTGSLADESLKAEPGPEPDELQLTNEERFQEFCSILYGMFGQLNASDEIYARINALQLENFRLPLTFLEVLRHLEKTAFRQAIDTGGDAIPAFRERLLGLWNTVSAFCEPDISLEGGGSRPCSERSSRSFVDPELSSSDALDEEHIPPEMSSEERLIRESAIKMTVDILTKLPGSREDRQPGSKFMNAFLDAVNQCVKLIDPLPLHDPFHYDLFIDYIAPMLPDAVFHRFLDLCTKSVYPRHITGLKLYIIDEVLVSKSTSQATPNSPGLELSSSMLSPAPSTSEVAPLTCSGSNLTSNEESYTRPAPPLTFQERLNEAMKNTPHVNTTKDLDGLELILSGIIKIEAILQDNPVYDRRLNEDILEQLLKRIPYKHERAFHNGRGPKTIRRLREFTRHNIDRLNSYRLPSFLAIAQRVTVQNMANSENSLSAWPSSSKL